MAGACLTMMLMPSPKTITGGSGLEPMAGDLSTTTAGLIPLCVICTIQIMPTAWAMMSLSAWLSIMTVSYGSAPISAGSIILTEIISYTIATIKMTPVRYQMIMAGVS